MSVRLVRKFYSLAKIFESAYPSAKTAITKVAMLFIHKKITENFEKLDIYNNVNKYTNIGIRWDVLCVKNYEVT